MTAIHCEQPGCPFSALYLVYSEDTLFLLCGEHEDELARIDGEQEQETFTLDFLDLTEVVEFINQKFKHYDKRYVSLLNEYDKLRKAKTSEAV